MKSQRSESRGATITMSVLANARDERVAQNLAKGMSADAAYTAAGFKPHRGNASRKRSKEHIVSRVAELQGSTADQIMDVRDTARLHTKAAIETMVSVMNDTAAPASARITASQGILDRGYGKPTQHIEAEPNVLDSLTYEQRVILINALKTLEEERSENHDETTQH